MSHVETFKVQQQTPSTYWSMKKEKDDLRIRFKKMALYIKLKSSTLNKKIRLIALTCSIDETPLLSNEVLLRIHEESVLLSLPLQP